MKNPQNNSGAATRDMIRRAQSHAWYQSQFSVPQMPAHSHNTKDSIGIPFSNIVGYQNYRGVANMTLTSAQILALFSTPIVLLNAPNPNTIIIVEGIGAYLNFNSIAYAGTNPLVFSYTGGGGQQVTSTIGSAFIDATSSTYVYAPPLAGAGSAFYPVAGGGIQVSVSTANPTAGNSTITFSVAYRLINLT